jgi:hypothetical protein
MDGLLEDARPEGLGGVNHERASKRDKALAAELRARGTALIEAKMKQLRAVSLERRRADREERRTRAAAWRKAEPERFRALAAAAREKRNVARAGFSLASRDLQL